ncbi:dihydropteroate synthase [Thermaerobacter marianensis DSM 12885]|uniref:7,8-dihydroneopterin aldolase n=1 Tax=Thermaerobacter marianensis (strain ATCC 700841 / DSM 12885 / JCM 10246 / 7p75a) TaxID=644966 RepID=E6SLJ6_THEM7|nr:dihydropteroate synthase [Thermaerobacter marianensis]ADU50263.1 dihydropteroate synthase [Thermaerobacter marianensis DSM 12885]
MSPTWQVIPGGLAWGERRFVWGTRTYVMGILNVTPDSFSDGGRYLDPAAAEEHALAMAEAGADIIDVGAESTRPGAAPVPAEEELRRLLPVIRRLVPRLDVPISVDTYKAEVARAALEEGAAMINDVGGLHRDPAMAEVAAAHRVPVVAMHARPHGDTAYADFWGEIVSFLRAAMDRATAAGLPPGMVIVDPGFGFGKTPEQNLDLVRQLPRLRGLGAPVLLGTSRKSTIGRVLDLPVDQRLEGTAATVALAIARGVDVVRVHDVAPMVRLVRMADAIARHPHWTEGDEPARRPGAAARPAAGTEGAVPAGPGPLPAPASRSVIQLRALRFEARHGVLPEEHVKPQPFLVDVDLGLDVTAAAKTDDLALTVDYGEVHRRVARIVQGPHRQLIETLAHQVASDLLDAFPVDWVRVRVAKPEAPLPGPSAGAAVEVWRNRDGARPAG